MTETYTCRYCGEPIEIFQLPNDPDGYTYKHDSAGCILDHDPDNAPAVQVWEHDELVAALNMRRMTCETCAKKLTDALAWHGCKIVASLLDTGYDGDDEIFSALSCTRWEARS